MEPADQPKFAVGEEVEILGVPDWLVSDLPKNERDAIFGCIGKTMRVTEIDEFGGIWVGFGESRLLTTGDLEYRGQCFVIAPDCIRRAKEKL